MDPRYDLFLGPQGERSKTLRRLLERILERHVAWRRRNVEGDPSLYPEEEDPGALAEWLETLLDRLEDQIPYPSPRYAAQMLKDPSLPYVVGYLSGMLSNPNNHAFEGGNVTTWLEMEVVTDLLGLVGFTEGWGHLASGGSLANLEAMWAVRDSGREGRVLFSEASHYSWERICSILRVEEFETLPVDAASRLDVDALRAALERGPALMVMANLGTTGCGAVDPLPEILELRDRHGFHLHVDAAYGGFLRTVILDPSGGVRPFAEVADLLSREAYDAMAVLGNADSVTVDPHKHGTTAYGVGGILYKHEALRQVILNTCPYTYHVKDKPNIGTFMLEGSRPGAGAAGVWLTHRTMPLHAEGMGRIHAECLKAARALQARLVEGGRYRVLGSPDLDLLCFFDPADGTVGGANERTLAVYEKLSVENPDAPFILSKFDLTSAATARAVPDLAREEGEALVALRAVFIKHWASLSDGYYLDELARELARAP